MPTMHPNMPGSALSIPPTQNTAPVIEYNCLYTHDLRRKAKRWQDGFLRLHTFNRRVMVYDIPRNLVGDTHLTEGRTLSEGDEIRLEKGGVLVEVADKIGQTETDLSNVLKIKNPATSSSPLRPHDTPISMRPSRQPLQEKHRSLNALLGAERAPIGKAILPGSTSYSTRSPFEVRKQEEQTHDWTQPPSAKRRKLGDARSGQAQADPPVKWQKQQAAPRRAVQVEPTRKAREEVIDLCSDGPEEPYASSMLSTPANRRATSEHPSRTIRAAVQGTSTAQGPTKHAAQSAKRLQVVKPSVKRNTLTCIPSRPSDEDADIEDQQRQRLEQRILRMRERVARSTAKQALQPLCTRQHETVDTQMPDRTDDARHELYGLDTAETDMLAALVDNEVEVQAPTDRGPSSDTIVADEVLDEPKTPTGHALMDVSISDVGNFDAVDDDAIFDQMQDIQTMENVETSHIEQSLSEFAGLSPHEPLRDDGSAIDTAACLFNSPKAASERCSEPDYDRLNAVDAGERFLATNGRAPSVEWSSCGIDASLKDSPAATGLDTPHNERVETHDCAQGENLAQSQKCVEAHQMPSDAATPPIDAVPAAELGAGLVGDDASTAAAPSIGKPRKRHGVGRPSVLSSVSASFKPPKLSARISNPVGLDSGTHDTSLANMPIMTSTISAGAWSREAFDLMLYRPPNWDEEAWCQAQEAHGT